MATQKYNTPVPARNTQVNSGPPKKRPKPKKKKKGKGILSGKY